MKTENNQTSEQKQKRSGKAFRMLEKIGVGSATVAPLAILSSVPALADTFDPGDISGDVDTSTSNIGQNLMILANLVAYASIAIGVVLLILGVAEFGIAYSQHDAASQSTALRRIVGGLLVTAVVSIVRLFAF